MVPEAEHIEEAVLNSFDDIITAAQSVDDISVKVWGAGACRGSVSMGAIHIRQGVGNPRGEQG